MLSAALMVMARAEWANSTTNTTLYEMATGTTTATAGGNSTLALINSLVFAESKSVRTSTIILATFNSLASFATAASILYDCYWASKRCNPKFKASKFCVSSLHPAETFPLVLAIGITIQGLVFAGVSGEGLESLFTSGCSQIAQIMWPALFIVPYIQLVFGLECAFRSMRKLPFQARGKYDVTICCGVIVTMLIATWIPSHIFPQKDFCLASLVWFISRYGELGAVILSTAGGLMIISALVIFIRLSTMNMIDEHQRIAASRMVYYLALGIISLAFVIPYFGSLIVKSGEIKLSMMATVVLNLSGLMNGLLQLFLRSNTATTSFAPKFERSWDRGRQPIRIWGPNELVNELAFTNHLRDPVSGPRSPTNLSRVDSQASLFPGEKGRVISMDSLQNQPYLSPKHFEAEMSSLPAATAPKSPEAVRTHTKNRPSYSLFPAEPSPANPNQREELSSIYDISDLVPPPRLFAGGRHKRDSSVVSSATVQIGLRLSHAPDCPPDAPALPSTTYNAKSTNPTSQKRETGPALQPTTYMPSSKSTTTSPSSKATLTTRMILNPLQVQTTFPATLSAGSPLRQSPLFKTTNARSPATPPPEFNKTLPRTPKMNLPMLNTLKQDSRASNTQLSPAVYSPENRIEVSNIPASTTSPRNPLKSNPLGSPQRNFSNSDSSIKRNASGSASRIPIRAPSGNARNPVTKRGQKQDWI